MASIPIKNMATAAALVALREKYKKPAPAKVEKKDPMEEMDKLIDNLNSAKIYLNTGLDRFIGRASKGGIANSEIIKLTAKLNVLSKTLG